MYIDIQCNVKGVAFAFCVVTITLKTFGVDGTTVGMQEHTACWLSPTHGNVLFFRCVDKFMFGLWPSVGIVG